jgi:hypothetical protein
MLRLGLVLCFVGSLCALPADLIPNDGSAAEDSASAHVDLVEGIALAQVSGEYVRLTIDRKCTQKHSY